MSNKAIKDESVFETRRFTSAFFFFRCKLPSHSSSFPFFQTEKERLGGGWVGNKDQKRNWEVHFREKGALFRSSSVSVAG